MRRIITVGLIFATSALSLAAEDKGSSSATVGKHVHYSGKVQGVGFRATATEIAQKFTVTGWVRNLDDGRVELRVEGPEKEVDKFLEAVRQRWKDNIEKEQVDDAKPTGEFKSFEVRR